MNISMSAARGFFAGAVITSLVWLTLTTLLMVAA